MAKPVRRRPLQRRRRFGGFLLRWVLLALIGLGLVGTLYSVHLDRIVRAKFEGQRWALPARVYARPLELYLGRPLFADQLEGELDRLNYRRVETPTLPGHYHREGDRFLVNTRSFRFWDGEEPARRLEIRLRDGQVADLADAAGGFSPALVRIEPMLIANIYPTHNEDRVLVRRKDLPDLLVAGLIAVEDRSFYRHLGVDPRGIARAAYSNLRAGGVVEGASTLTQQLVKNFYLTADRTFERKINEALMALLLERRYGKDEILEAYANEIYLGQDGSRAIHGFGLASRFFFNKSLSELSVPETALLVGIVQAPSTLDPRRRPEAALSRRNLVLDLMARDNVISSDVAESAKRTPLGLAEGGGRPVGNYPDFVSLVRRQLQRDYRDEDLRSEGLQIFTTLDPLVQSVVEQSLPTQLAELETSRRMTPGTLEVATVVTSVAQGEVLALAGGREPGFAGFNRALDSVRSIGSLVKPAIYLAALAQPQRYGLTTNLQDSPVNLRVGNDTWSPQNYDRRVHGAVPLHRALSSSLNLATVNLGLSLGLTEVTETLYRLGVQRNIVRVPAMLLGAVSMSPLEVAQIYQTIAAGGYRAPLRAIREVVDANGRPLNRYPLSVEQAVDPHAAYLTTWAMERVVTHGTARWLGSQLPKDLRMAGKTGTTDDMRDSWFAGFSGDKVAVVWVGRDDYQPMGLAGGTGALRVWGDLMLALPNESIPRDPPDGVVAGSGDAPPYVAGTRPPSGRQEGGDEGTGTPRQDVVQAAAEATPEPSSSSEDRSPRRAPERQNHFLSDFFSR
ncbi:penicillin-binding protein 1B [Thiocapsa imhoffii]|uniref:Penicillin-binding protein 1B n=1 Tax=Thiocapsa imhoffii TaxID=382777 RepID=A0A9X1B7L1_9GAMM|nr:penicillin-binding protein 1B [Thiocapsa imhoffii]MBK1643954.1 penicillin-binding protein 1B [Thiocapsa imhoffii]